MIDPKIIPDRAQMTRWRQILTVPAPVAAMSPNDLSQQLCRTRNQHRIWMTTCLAAIEAIRQGTIIDVDGLLPSRPARRPAAEGSFYVSDVWQTYLQWTAHGSVTTATWLSEAIDLLSPTALVFTANDNPEPWWQNEMLVLHAFHSFALRTRDESLLGKTLACADFHLREIQPDHATNEPWAVHAYASHPDGNVTAETLLHAAFIQGGGQLNAVASLIARDAARALAAYLEA